MTGLKAYRRDAELPARAGEPELSPPSPEELLALVRAYLAPPSAAAPVRAELAFARWKPRTAITAVYALAFEDGRETLVTFKRYRGDKARSIERSYEPDEHVEREATALLPFHVDVERGLCLYALPADRELPGFARAYDLQRSARLLTGHFPGRLRWRRSAATLLRYKPEHRAVLRLDLVLRDESEALVDARAALRVLPVHEAERVVATRAAAFADTRARLAPDVLHAEARTGLLFERWLDVQTYAGDRFEHEEDAGALLAELHSASADERDFAPRVRQDASDLFAIDARLATSAATLPPPPRARARTFLHGDFHPDQVARRRDGSGFVLLDLDAVRGGEPEEDLAAWTADALAAGAGRAMGLHDAYLRSGGMPIDIERFRAFLVQELRERAAASVRRLELGAVDRAAALLTLAREASRS